MRDGNTALVRAARSGDRTAIREIHDRSCGRVYDHCSAVLRDHDAAASVMTDTFMLAFVELHRLRDPSKLEPWLFALARDQMSYRPRSPVPPPDRGNPFAPMMTQARSLAWEAAGWFPRRERIVLDLHVRQELERDDLAVAIGASISHAMWLADRLEERVDRLIGALLVARLARDCRRLDEVPEHAFDARVTMRRYTHHVDRCKVCSAARRELPSPTELIASVPADAEPPELRGEALERVHLVLRALESAAGTGDDDDTLADPVLSPVPASGGWPGTGTAIDEQEPDVTEVVDALDAADADTEIEVGSDDDANAGGYDEYDLILELTPPPVPLKRNGFPHPLFPERRRLVATAAVLVAALVALVVAFDVRGVESGSPELLAGAAAPPTVAAPPPTTAPATTAPVATTAPDAVSPTVSNLATTYACIDANQPTTFALATVTDDRRVESVDLVVEHAVLGATRKAMYVQDGQYRATIGPYGTEGTITWSVEASDGVHTTRREGPLVAALASCAP